MHAFKERFAFICQTQNLYYTDRPKSGLNLPTWILNTLCNTIILSSMEADGRSNLNRLVQI